MAKRVSSSSVNWSIIQGRLMDEKAYFSMKSKLDKYLRQVAIHSAELPKIDWSQYQNKLPKAVVDSYQKSYGALTVPYPSDQGFIDKLKKMEADLIKTTSDMDANTVKEIAELTSSLKNLESQIPYSEMSLEEFILARPEFKFDENNPKLWPQFLDTHLPEPPKVEYHDH